MAWELAHPDPTGILGDHDPDWRRVFHDEPPED